MNGEKEKPDRKQSKTMALLASLMHAVHNAIGISVPSPEQDRLYLFIWLGALVAMIAWMTLLFYLFLR